ncbi:MAG: extracellular solute-binding protein [Proteobacteria bacterium]|nr:extracellular solute-binding protein [Pseudomonadota bacterium]MBI3498867.1 extracellular solute-binding protein [Pseudomonadota bacterium]
MKPGKLLARFLAGAAIAVSAAAIGSSPAGAQQVTIKMWMHEHPPRIAIDKAIIADFEKANPDVKIQYEVIPVAEYPTKLLTAFASGAGPDLFNQYSGLVGQYYNARILAPIDYAAMGYAEEKALIGQYSSGFEGIRFQGKAYGIPTEVSNYGCYANNALWKEAGLDPAKDFPKTWEAMQSVAEKLTKRDTNGVPIRRGFDFNWVNRNAFWNTLNSLMHQRQAEAVDEEAYKATLDTPAGQKVMQFLADWSNKQKLGGPQYTDSRTDFLGGKLATECSMGIWGIPQMKDAKIDFTVQPAPRFADATNDSGFDAYAFYMMVNARSSAAVQKAAWKLARSYVDRAGELFAGAGLFVPKQEVAAKAGDANSQVFLTELKKAKFSPRVVGFDQVLDGILRGRDRIIQGAEPVPAVLASVNEDLNATLKRERARFEAMRK